MRSSTTTCAALVAALLWLCIGWPAWAQNLRRIEGQILEMHRDAMARYDELEFEQAKDLLREAVALATEHGLEDEPVMARVYADLAVVYASGLDDRDGAERALTRAVEIDPSIEIERAYKSKALDALLADIKRRVAERGPTPRAGAPIRCKEIAGIVHDAVTGADAGQALEIAASVSPRLRAHEVRLQYRLRGQEAYTIVPMEPVGECGYVVELPGRVVRGTGLDYYIAAFNASGRILAESGGADEAYAITVRGAAGAVESEPSARRAAAPRLLLGLGGGSAGAFLRGSTEQIDSEIQCCVAPELVHARVEVGYYLTERTGLSATFRLGFPIGANLPGHAVAAPALLLRLRRAFAPRALGLQLSAVLGVGYARHTVGLAQPMAGGDTDTAATGPLLAGAGVGHVWALGGPLRLITELDALVGVPVVAQFAGAETAFGVHVGASIALQAAF
jgi:hypothetical protein